MIRPYEPNVVKGAWAIFGKSYEYRQKYNEYKERRRKDESQKAADAKCAQSQLDGQIRMEETK